MKSNIRRTRIICILGRRKFPGAQHVYFRREKESLRNFKNVDAAKFRIANIKSLHSVYVIYKQYIHYKKVSKTIVKKIYLHIYGIASAETTMF